MVTNTLVASTEARFGNVAAERSDSFLIDNPSGNDFPGLLRKAGVKTGKRSGLVSRWKQFRRSRPGEYGLKEYRFGVLPEGATFSTRELLAHFKCRFFHPHATTYELLASLFPNQSHGPHHLSEGRKLIALGRDQFNCSIDGSFSQIDALDGDRILRTIEGVHRQIWDSSFMFLMRVD